MTLPGRRKAIVVLAVVLVFLSPAAVSAAFWIVLDRTSGPSGAIVHGRTLGSGSVTVAPSRSLPMFLVEQDLASQIDDPADERLIRLGELVVDADGDGTTTFTIPNVVPGEYDVLVHCEPCVPSSAGATMLYGADLEVIMTPPATDTDPQARHGEWPPRLFLVTVAILVLFLRVHRVRLTRA